MAKTKEELNNLKNEIIDINAKLNELSEDELNDVVGGINKADTIIVPAIFAEGIESLSMVGGHRFYGSNQEVAANPNLKLSPPVTDDEICHS